MDLFSQAEHDELAQSILLCPDAAYIDAVRSAIDRLLPEHAAPAVIRASLKGRGALIRTRSMEEACEISNRIAPEHLEVSSATRIAGSRCCGTPARSSSAPTPARAWGTTAPGPNHVLPTSGTARFSSPLGVYDFQKRSSLIEVSEAGARCWGRSRSSWPMAKACKRMPAPPRCACRRRSRLRMLP
jgi:histidinol dehydrogenase